MVKYMNKSVSFESLGMDGFRVGFKWVPAYFRVLLKTDAQDKRILFFLFGWG